MLTTRQSRKGFLLHLHDQSTNPLVNFRYRYGINKKGTKFQLEKKLDVRDLRKERGQPAYRGRRLGGDEVREAGGGQIIRGLSVHGKETGFHPNGGRIH